MRIILRVFTVAVFIFLVSSSCRQVTGPTYPAATNTPDKTGTVVVIVSTVDAARATQTMEAALSATAQAALFTATMTQTITPTYTRTLTETFTVSGTPTGTKTSTMTITPTFTQTPTHTSTRTSTSTPTSTETPPFYVLYDDFTVPNNTPADSGKWTSSATNAESFVKVLSSKLYIKADTVSAAAANNFAELKSTFPGGTQAFKGSIYNVVLLNEAYLKISFGNETSGYELLYSHFLFGGGYGGGMFIGNDIFFEVKKISGNTYSITVGGQPEVTRVYTVQPQIFIQSESKYNAGRSAAQVALDDVYYY